MDFWFSSSLYGLPMSSLHPESALAGVMNEDAKCQPLLRDISFSSNSSQSLLSTPTLSSFSYTQSSSGFSGLDTPPESIQDEDFEFCVDSTPRLDALGEVNEERLHRAMTFPRSGHLELDLDGGYESEVEDSQKFVRQKLRKRFSTPSAAPATKQKAGLAPRRPTSDPSYSKTIRSFLPASPHTTARRMAIDLGGLQHPPFHNGSCLGIPGTTSPGERYRAISSPTDRTSPFSPTSPPGAPSLRGIALPFSPSPWEDTASLFPAIHSEFSPASSPDPSSRTLPRARLLPPIPLPMISPPLYPTPSKLRHQLRSVTMPSPPLSSRDSSLASRTPAPPASLSSRVVMLNRRLSLARKPPRPKTPPVPPKLVGSSRLETLMGAASPAASKFGDSEALRASRTETPPHPEWRQIRHSRDTSNAVCLTRASHFYTGNSLFSGFRGNSCLFTARRNTQF